MKVLSVVGTRPELIKMAPVIRALASAGRDIESRVCATAQHRDLLDPLIALFGLTVDDDLDVMRPHQSLSDVTARVLSGLAPILERERPDWVLVQGDTTTTMAAALGAHYHHIRVGHIEAGLRTGRLDQPFPEEGNRRIVSVLADLHFAPTEQAKANLVRENVPAARVLVTGNTAIDALQWAIRQSAPSNGLVPASAADAAVVLVTAHRRESFGEPLRQICHALRDLAARYADRIHLVYPVHPNPNVNGPVRELLGGLANVTLTPPVDYLALVHLLHRARFVITDSGGIQEEAPSLGKPVLVIRETTERPEGVAAGTARLVGTDRKRILAEACRLLDDPSAYDAMAHAVNPYGDGRAAERILAALLSSARAS